MFQLVIDISHTPDKVNGNFDLGTFRTGHFQSRMFWIPFVGSITNTEIVKHTKYHSSVQHVSLEVRVRYSCGGEGYGQFGIVLGHIVNVCWV